MIDSTIGYLEVLIQVRESTKLIIEWLNSAERESLTDVQRYVDRALEISADPRYDIFVIAGADADQVEEELRGRDYVRLVKWKEICIDGDESVIDAAKAEAAFAAIPEISQCRPRRVWCLWGVGETCPQGIREELDARLRKSLINRNTIKNLGANWAKHFIQNIPVFAKNGRQTLKMLDIAKGSGAVVVGAGPSLDLCIDWIKAQAAKPIIICAYKALKALHKNGITPDFVVMLDPNQQVRHLEGVDLSGIAGFVTEVSVWPDALAKVDRPVMPYYAGGSTRILSEVLGKTDIPTIPTGGSVIHTGLQLAKILGCEEITLVGADFGFPDKRLYADGSGSGDIFAVSQDGRGFVRRPLDGGPKSGTIVTVKATDGSELITSLELDQYRVWTEQFIADYKNRNSRVRFVNISPVGAAIEGADYVPMSEHVCRASTISVGSVVDTIPHLIARRSLSGGLPRRVQTKIRKLQGLARACRSAIADKRGDGGASSEKFGRVVKRATACPEVSLLLSPQLIELEEKSRRTAIDAPRRLRELVEIAASQADATVDLYRIVARDLVGPNQQVVS